ncbi:MAG: glycosyltransferase family 2 protein, partial [Planctomycetota bacterium]|nr:glycosyltransferase family 2 protein [Planctomycetota bacterium]
MMTAANQTDPPPSPGKRKGLVIVPAFNEADSIARVVDALRHHLPDFDVLVIDDGSKDATIRRVPASAAAISLPFNLGIGGAMQTGYRYAALNGYEIAVQVDADGQHPAHAVGKLVEAMKNTGADMVIGSRFVEGGSYEQ